MVNCGRLCALNGIANINLLPLIGLNQIANLIWVKFSTWRALIALNWLSLYPNSYFVLFVLFVLCVCTMNIIIYIIK